MRCDGGSDREVVEKFSWPNTEEAGVRGTTLQGAPLRFARVGSCHKHIGLTEYRIMRIIKIVLIKYMQERRQSPLLLPLGNYYIILLVYLLSTTWS